jgi:hypothetical protein
MLVLNQLTGYRAVQYSFISLIQLHVCSINEMVTSTLRFTLSISDSVKLITCHSSSCGQHAQKLATFYHSCRREHKLHYEKDATKSRYLHRHSPVVARRRASDGRRLIHGAASELRKSSVAIILHATVWPCRSRQVDSTMATRHWRASQRTYCDVYSP